MIHMSLLEWAKRAMMAGIALALQCGAVYAAPPGPIASALPTPPGFQVRVTREGLVWATPDGMSVYTHVFDVPYTGEIRCEHGCPDAFTMALAPANAKPVGDWKIYEREEGRRQWAYKGWPVWHFVDDAKPGDSFGQGDYAEWSLLFYDLPPPKIKAPSGVTLQLSKTGGYVLADSRGRTLYVRDAKVSCDGECARDFPYLVAPALAHRMGSWSIRVAQDGISQWLYKGAPVHTSVFDRAPGELFGEERAGGWRAIEIPQKK